MNPKRQNTIATANKTTTSNLMRRIKARTSQDTNITNTTQKNAVIDFNGMRDFAS